MVICRWVFFKKKMAASEGYHTLLDEIEQNALSQSARAFALRMVYVAGHGCENKKRIATAYEAILKGARSDYSDVPVNGVVLIYEKHLVVMCEGSEHTLVHHARSLLNSKELRPILGVVKLAAIYHNVKTRYFTTWTTVNVHSAETMLATVDYEKLTSFREHFEVFKNFLEHMKGLQGVENENVAGSQSNDDDDDEISMELYPCTQLLDFILTSEYTMNLGEYAKIYLNLPEYRYSFETSWPAPFDYTPSLDKEEISPDSFIQLLSSIEDFKRKSDDGSPPSRKEPVPSTTADESYEVEKCESRGGAENSAHDANDPNMAIIDVKETLAGSCDELQSETTFVENLEAIDETLLQLSEKVESVEDGDEQSQHSNDATIKSDSDVDDSDNGVADV